MKNVLKYMATAAICAACAFTFSACDDSSTGATDTEITSSDSGNNGGDNGNDENGGKSSAIAPASSESKAASSSSETKAPANTSEGIIKKLQIGADETGIYGTVIELNTSLAGEKGEIEMLYYSSETGIETQVNDFVLQYERDANGTYEVHTFSDGEVYLNKHKQSEIKFTNEFGAMTRADRVEIYYTPDGGQKELVRTATADDFREK